MTPATLTRSGHGGGVLTLGRCTFAISGWEKRSPGLFRFIGTPDGFSASGFTLDVRAGTSGTMAIDGIVHDVTGWRVTGAVATFNTDVPGPIDDELAAQMAPVEAWVRA